MMKSGHFEPEDANRMNNAKLTHIDDRKEDDKHQHTLSFIHIMGTGVNEGRRAHYGPKTLFLFYRRKMY